MTTLQACRPSVLWLALAAAGCGGDESGEEPGGAVAAAAADYCSVTGESPVPSLSRPDDSEEPIDDVNWFARPVPHDGTDYVVAFASHSQNYLYNLSQGVRIRIPDRSDAVATPDGRYITVPSYYTADSTVRFYPTEPMLERLERGQDATDIPPAFVDRNPAMRRVYYQSAGIVSTESTDRGDVTTYRLMFSGTNDPSGFRIVDYRFTHDPGSGALVDTRSSPAMALCPLVRNDLNTPFISKDGRYVAAYTSESAEAGYGPGASLKIFEITATDPAGGTTSCRTVVDFGFAAGKADFSFDGSMLTFHISQGGYLTPFINGGLEGNTITDVVVARLERDQDRSIVGVGDLQRLTASFEPGIGSYFPAFFPDGALFFIANATPKDSNDPKRFSLEVVDPVRGVWRSGVFRDVRAAEGWAGLNAAWERLCASRLPGLGREPFPLEAHEAPWLALSLSSTQCRALVEDGEESSGGVDVDWQRLAELCRTLPD